MVVMLIRLCLPNVLLLLSLAGRVRMCNSAAAVSDDALRLFEPL